MSTVLKTRKKVSKKDRSAAEPIIPELELEWFQPPALQPDRKETEGGGSVRFGWIGSGPDGGRLAEAFYQLGYKTLAVSSATEDLDGLKLPEESRLLMSARKSHRGGGHALFGRLEEQFDNQVDHLMICPGGEAGGDLELIEWVQNYARLLGFQGARRRVGAMILPSEDPTVAKQLIGLAGQKKILPLILVAGGKKRKSPSRKKSPAAVYRRAAELFDGFNQLSGRPTPYTSFDTMDYLEVLTAGGCTVMGMTEAEPSADRHAISRAIRKVLDTMMTAGGRDLRAAKAGACLVVGGREMMAGTAGLQDAILYGFDVLAALTGRATIHRGIYEDDCPSLRIYTMLSGLPAPQSRLKKLNS
jgi:hypothetical protein